jgi:hypothetical protein
MFSMPSTSTFHCHRFMKGGFELGCTFRSQLIISLQETEFSLRYKDAFIASWKLLLGSRCDTGIDSRSIHRPLGQRNNWLHCWEYYWKSRISKCVSLRSLVGAPAFHELCVINEFDRRRKGAIVANIIYYLVAWGIPSSGMWRLVGLVNVS